MNHQNCSELFQAPNTNTNAANGNVPQAQMAAKQEIVAQMDEVRRMAKRTTELLYQEYSRRAEAEARVASLEKWKAQKEAQEKQREAALREQKARMEANMQSADAQNDTSKKTGTPQEDGMPQKNITVKELAEELQKLGIMTGQKRLFAWLRESGYVIRSGSGHNRPSPKSRELGFLTESAQSYQRSNGKVEISYTVRVTPKGQQYFKNLFVWYKEEVNARETAKNEAQRLRKNEKQRAYNRVNRSGQEG